LDKINIVLSHIPGLSSLPPSGKLPHCLRNWQAITADRWVLQTVQGYCLELECTPHQQTPPCPLVNPQHQLAVQGEVQKLLDKQAIVCTAPCPQQFLSRLFLVSKKDGSFRPVVNLKPLNQFMTKCHFKMEGINMLKDLLLRNDWMASLDLKDAYFSVAVREEDRKYLRFSWAGQTFEFQCLPFGLSSAPRVFTKLLKPIVAFLRRQGIRLVIFLDDMVVLAQSKEDLEAQMSQISQMLCLLGFTINWEKSQLTPSQLTQFLGFLIDSQNMMIRLTKEKTELLVQTCRAARQQGRLSVRDLSRLIGRMTATIPAISQAPLWYRNLQNVKNQALRMSGSYEAVVALTQGALEELDWWTTVMASCNGRSVLNLEADLIMESDASQLGWGAVCSGIRTGGLWFPTERQAHINCLELTAAAFAVKAFARNKKDAHIHLKLDNQTAVAYINHMGGTRSSQLNNLATELWRWCLERGLTLSAEHLAGVDNYVADAESRTIQSSAEWQLHKDVFQSLMQNVFQCDVDLFATRLNCQLPQFVSWRPDPFAFGTDALRTPWTRWRGYAFPPFALINKVLRKVREERSTVLLIAPVWESQPWYPALLSLLVNYPTLLPVHHSLLADPYGQPHPLVLSGQLRLAAWTLSGEVTMQQEFQKKLHNYCSLDGVKEPTQPTSLLGRSGLAGVSQGKLIPFHVLSNPSLIS